MALGTPVITGGGSSPSAPVFVDQIVAQLDDSYPGGGYDFQLLVDGQGLLGEGRTLLGAVHVAVRDISSKAPNPQYELHYQVSTQKLMLIDNETSAEVAGTPALSGHEAVLLVLSY